MLVKIDNMIVLIFAKHFPHTLSAILVALFSLSSCRLMLVVWIFLAVPLVCLQFVIVVFPDHTHLLFSVLFVDFLKKKTF